VVTKEEWLTLAERCEKATGPDRDIDAEIYDATTHHLLYAGEYAGKRAVRRSGGAVWLPFFTYSIDDITALIEREMPKAMGSVQFGESVFPASGGYVAQLIIGEPDYTCEGRTPALALCAAFCRAKAAGA
jgi:hypothetical protein